MSKDIKLSGQPVLCQFFSFIPNAIIEDAVAKCGSDRYYKTMTTKKQLACLLYGVITRINSLQSVCKSLRFLENKLSYIGIEKIPPVSTLSDANIKRGSEVFGEIYSQLLTQYQSSLFRHDFNVPINGEVDPSLVKLLDATTVTLFVDIFKAAGRPPLTGKQKGGIKVHSERPLIGRVPDLIYITEASCNDKVFLGQLKAAPGTIYVFDKGYISYFTFESWGKQGTFYVTRLKENATFKVVKSIVRSPDEYATGGVIKDEVIECILKGQDKPLTARLVTYKDPLSGTILQFFSNMFDCDSSTIATLYKFRWEMEVLFKRIKGNFQLDYFYSDSPEGIKTQIWIVLIANLVFSVIHRQIKESEQFATLIAMAANNLGSYICFITFLKTYQKSRRTPSQYRNYQVSLFMKSQGGLFDNVGKSP